MANLAVFSGLGKPFSYVEIRESGAVDFSVRRDHSLWDHNVKVSKSIEAIQIWPLLVFSQRQPISPNEGSTNFNRHHCNRPTAHYSLYTLYCPSSVRDAIGPGRRTSNVSGPT